jgi:hypothetical protein
MDWQHHVTRELIEAKLAERRAEAARQRLALLVERPPRVGLRVALGRGLVRLGSWIAAGSGHGVAVSDLRH